jgi:single-stranded DNA-binding protein
MKAQFDIIGRLVADAKFDKTRNDKDIAFLRVAVSERQKNKDGNWEDVTHYANITIFNARAISLLKATGVKGSMFNFMGQMTFASVKHADEFFDTYQLRVGNDDRVIPLDTKKREDNGANDGGFDGPIDA